IQLYICKDINYKLTELNLSFNKLMTLPEGLNNNLPNLVKLQLKHNNLKILPDSDLGLKALKTLELSHNCISSIPEDFLKSCISLETFKMSNNKLESLPSENVAIRLVKLNKIILRKNMISERDPLFIPKFILQLPSIRSVDLSNNLLNGLPPPIMWKSTMLKELSVSKNNIVKLNLEGAKCWLKLESLNLADNKLLEIPKEIGQLTNLTSLNISYNKLLTTLPDELGRCSRIWELGLEGLHLDFQDSLIKGRVKDLIIYLHNKLKKAKRHYHLKLMVVGYGGRGKSTLLRALRKKYKPRDQQPLTVGVIVEDWRFERYRRDVGRYVTYTLSTWDFAGQEEFYSTHQCFLSNRALYLAVYDMSEGLKDVDALKPWLSNIQARAPGCPVIVVGTHIDKIPKESQRKMREDITNKLHELASKPGFPVICESAVVDCTNENPGIEELRNSIKNVIDNYSVRGQPVMGQKVPASYVKLIELLSEEARNLQRTSCVPIIRHKQLVKIVQNTGLNIDENDELEQAVRFLHESGVLLHYEDSANQLKDLYFIDPGWLCRMMAQIITIREINPFIDYNGILKKEHVELLFTGRAVNVDANIFFPSNLIPQYLKLLEKFEIALPHTDTDMLIPCCLPEEIPELRLPNLTKEEKICRYYCMPYLPIGIWPRLITRLITYSNSIITESLMIQEGLVNIKCWRKGICGYWNDGVFFRIESVSTANEEIHIMVPATNKGSMLLGQVVDHVDALIEEWYPGLTTIDPLLGHELLEKIIPCPFCPGPDLSSYLFRVDDLIALTENNIEVTCPHHGQSVPISVLAPDLVMKDLESALQLRSDSFYMSESPDCLLGDGGFGSVYRGSYEKQAVAVKVFMAIGDIPPHRILNGKRQVTILRALRHPNVVSMLAVGLHPRIIVLELAAHGSLGDVLKNGSMLNKVIQHRIAAQISEGLGYLHQLLILYRDMKPDNILIFSLSPSATVNAKISDYGIARFSTLYGLKAQEGTPAYRAPEVIRGETYSFQADVFSLGITLFVMVTSGRHPFDELEFKSEMDQAIAEGVSMPNIAQKAGILWPDLQDLISSCLNQIPDSRPKTVEVTRRLYTAELYCLQRIIPVSITTTVECFAVQEQFGDQLQLWVASGDIEYMQLSWLNLLDYNMEVKGAIFSEGRILCLQPIGSGFLLLGTQMGHVWVFDTLAFELRHSTALLLDAVLCLHLIQESTDDARVLAGLASGMIAVFYVTDILNVKNVDPIYLNLASFDEPVKCMVSRGDKVFISCGCKIVVMKVGNGIVIEKMIDTMPTGDYKTVIYTMAVSSSAVFCSRKNSSVLEVWDTDREKLWDSVNLQTVLGIEKPDARITALSVQRKKCLWVGTGGGYIALLDIKTIKPVVLTCRYSDSVRCLLPVEETGYVKFSGVLSGGLGFRERSSSHLEKESRCGCVAVWAWDFLEKSKSFEADRKRRQQLSDYHSRNDNIEN
ncbi:hypothetical protein ScPMuIL_008120, partial [Solemya velum]